MTVLHKIRISPVGAFRNHMMRQPKYGSNRLAAPLAANQPPISPNAPTSTRLQPRCLVGMHSASRAYVIGSMPPAASPIRKHIKMFHWKDGIDPQIAVPTNMTPDKRI